VLEDQEIRPVGSAQDIKLDLLIISSSNVDLDQLVKAGKFREDLYQRLMVVTLKLPPLRDRKDDLPLLARFFIKRYAREFGKTMQDIAPAALERLRDYGWPGNVRELRNIIERAVLIADGDVIEDRPSSPPGTFPAPRSAMIIYEEVIAFLKKIPPFQFLDPQALELVVGNLSMEFYPRDTIILKQYGPPSDSVRIIKKGSVKVLMAAEFGGEEVVIDYKGEGDTFGFLSLIGKDKQRTTVVAIDDTLCYILNKEGVHKLLEISPAFTEYYMSYLSRYVDRTYQEMYGKSLSYGSGDRFLFTTPVEDLAVAPITVREKASIREAARIMVEKKNQFSHRGQRP